MEICAHLLVIRPTKGYAQYEKSAPSFVSPRNIRMIQSIIENKHKRTLARNEMLISSPWFVSPRNKNSVIMVVFQAVNGAIEARSLQLLTTDSHLRGNDDLWWVADLLLL